MENEEKYNVSRHKLAQNIRYRNKRKMTQTTLQFKFMKKKFVFSSLNVGTTLNCNVPDETCLMSWPLFVSLSSLLRLLLAFGKHRDLITLVVTLLFPYSALLLA